VFRTRASQEFGSRVGGALFIMSRGHYKEGGRSESLLSDEPWLLESSEGFSRVDVYYCYMI